jgi:hypothetical protein
MTDLLSRLPELHDDDLATLRSNAERLSRGGTAKQRGAASAMLPAILAEIASRPQKKRPAARRKS